MPFGCVSSPRRDYDEDAQIQKRQWDLLQKIAVMKII